MDLLGSGRILAADGVNPSGWLVGGCCGGDWVRTRSVQVVVFCSRWGRKWVRLVFLVRGASGLGNCSTVVAAAGLVGGELGMDATFYLRNSTGRGSSPK